jgi:hypothetical protein
MSGLNKSIVIRSSVLQSRRFVGSSSDGTNKQQDAETARKQARNIDKVSRQIFPLAFILFNVVYWTVYAVPFGKISDEYD